MPSAIAQAALKGFPGGRQQGGISGETGTRI